MKRYFLVLDNLELQIEKNLLSLPFDFIDNLITTNLLLTYIERLITQSLLMEKELIKEDEIKLNNAYCKSHNIKNEEELYHDLNEQGIRYKDHINNLKTSFYISNIAMDMYEVKAEAHFLKRKDQLDKYTYSLLRAKDSDLAYELYLQIESKENNFADISRKYSEGPEKHTNGIIGPASIDKTHPLLKEQLKSSSKGDLIQPFKIEQWWVFTRLEEKVEASFNDAMKAKMSLELLNISITSISKRIAYKVIKSINN